MELNSFQVMFLKFQELSNTLMTSLLHTIGSLLSIASVLNQSQGLLPAQEQEDQSSNLPPVGHPHDPPPTVREKPPCGTTPDK